jgi:hypothetical protein
MADPLENKDSLAERLEADRQHMAIRVSEVKRAFSKRKSKNSIPADAGTGTVAEALALFVLRFVGLLTIGFEVSGIDPLILGRFGWNRAPSRIDGAHFLSLFLRLTIIL